MVRILLLLFHLIIFRDGIQVPLLPPKKRWHHLVVSMTFYIISLNESLELFPKAANVRDQEQAVVHRRLSQGLLLTLIANLDISAAQGGATLSTSAKDSQGKGG